MSCRIHSPYEHKGLRAVTDTGGQGHAWKQFEARRQPFYGPMARKAKAARDEVTAVAIEQVEQEMVPRMAVEAVRTSLAREERKGPTRDMVRGLFQTVGQRFVREAFNELKAREVKQDPEDEWFREVDRWMAAEGGEEVRRITETTRQDIMRILSSARADGLGTEEMAKRLESRIGDVNRQRGRVIARTETITASNKASHEGAKMTGLTLEKEWLNSNDPRVRDSHTRGGVAGQTQPLEKPFRWTGMNGTTVEAMYPGAAGLPAVERIQCRCVTTKSPVD